MRVPADATTYGSLGNFDAVNDTGKTAHGFEIDLEGISVSDVTDVFGGVGRYFPPTVERYGAPTITANAADTGVVVRYEAVFNNSTSSWNVGTPSGILTTSGESCWTGGGGGYGREHAVRPFWRRHQEDADQHHLQLADRDRGQFADVEQCQPDLAGAGADRDAPSCASASGQPPRRRRFRAAWRSRPSRTEALNSGSRNG